MAHESGPLLRWPALFATAEPIVVCPVDDALIFGPTAGLERIDLVTRRIVTGRPDAILTFAGHLSRSPLSLATIPIIVNCTASLIGEGHTRKVAITSVEGALRAGASGVAFHINIGSKHESEMLELAGSISEEARACGLPLIGIIYPRTEGESGDNNYDHLRKNDQAEYTSLVARCVALGAQLGCDVIKTKYTGGIDTFRSVCSIAENIAILIAGGELVSESKALDLAESAVQAGARGVSFGRNVFGREDPAHFIAKLRKRLSDCGGRSVGA